jgi:hypothetical protein
MHEITCTISGKPFDSVDTYLNGREGNTTAAKEYAFSSTIFATTKGICHTASV